VVVVGLVLHVFVAGVWGVLLARFAPRSSSWPASLAVGLLFGLLVMAVMTFLLLPRVDPPLFARVPGMQVSWTIAHLVYGASAAAVVTRSRRRQLTLLPPLGHPRDAAA
jgi:hypothetical protein